MKILVVDDSAFARKGTVKLITKVLGEVDIIQASGGLEAIEILKNEKLDMVFLDLTMPEISGIDVLEKVQPENLSCHIIVVTADIQHKTKERVIELGACCMINKPLDEEKLVSVLNDLDS